MSNVGAGVLLCRLPVCSHACGICMCVHVCACVPVGQREGAERAAEAETEGVGDVPAGRLGAQSPKSKDGGAPAGLSGPQ